MEPVLRVLELIGIGLSVLSVGFLGVAAVSHLRRPRSALPHGISARARRTQVFVGALVVIGLVSAIAGHVPLGYGWATIAAAGLLFLVLRRDERFWIALAPLIVVFTGIGVVILLALSHNFGQPDGEAFWYGGRQLIAWGGLRANPEAPGWETTIVALSILRYGLPLALVVTTTWLVSVRTSMTRGERLGLISAAEGVFVTVLLGAAVSIVVLSAGLLYGLPVVLVVLGAVGSVFTLVTVGPGAVAGIIVGGRTLTARLPRGTGEVATLVSSVETLGGDGNREGGTPEEIPPWRSLFQFMKGEVSPVRQWSLKALAFVVALFVLAAVGGPSLFGRVDDAQPVHFEPISKQVGVGFTVADFRRGSDGDVWLLGEQGDIALLKTGRGEVVHMDLRAWSLTTVDDQVFALTRESPARVVVLDAERIESLAEVVVLPERLAGQIAIDEGAVYLSDSTGTISRYSRNAGTLETSVADSPAEHLFATGSEVWTLHLDGDLARPYRLVPRDPQTLAVRGDPAGVDPVTLSSGDVEVDQRIKRVVTAKIIDSALDESPRFLGPLDSDPLWRAQRVGELYLLGAGEQERRFDFHYDTIHGVFESSAGTWLLVTDDQGTIIDTTEVTESYLALWEDGPLQSAPEEEALAHLPPDERFVTGGRQEANRAPR